MVGPLGWNTSALTNELQESRLQLVMFDEFEIWMKLFIESFVVLLLAA